MRRDTDRSEKLLGAIMLDAKCVNGIIAENDIIAAGLVLIMLATECGTLDRWQWIGSLIDDLTDNEESDRFNESIPPASPLNGRGYAAAEEIAALLDYWTDMGLLSVHDTLDRAFNTLLDRWFRNLLLLGEIP